MTPTDPHESQGVRLAMWSGPRNISTAMMRAWGNRSDTVVCDEPLYAHYLRETGLDHPGAEEVIASHETDWRAIVRWLTGPIPDGRSVFYQKHMAHHLLPEMERRWLRRLTNAFLIRNPREMLTSLIKVTPNPTVFDTGLPQQIEIYTLVKEWTGAAPPVLDARDTLEQPREMLRSLCELIGVPFDDQMLNWAPGPRETDGVWAKHWYDAVNRSSGFEPYRPKEEAVPARLSRVLDECMTYYEALHAERLVVS
ncbi:MAG: HAD family hydrolase [Phycisphaerales bacterium]